jgi:hypothetical protein
MRTTLEVEHRRIQALCARVEALLQASDQPNMLFLGPVCEELSAMLVQHMQFKEAMIYAPLRQKARATKLSTIEQMSDLCTSLYADYRAHRGDWPSERVAAEWACYRRATLELLERLDRAIQLERVHIYPLLTIVCEGAAPPEA